MRDKWFVRGLVTNITSAILVAGAGVLIGLLAKGASAWTSPVLYGLGGSALLSISLLVFSIMARLPRARRLPSTDNVESLVRLWLNNFRLAVKNDPNQEVFFRFVVTMDSGTKLLVGRPKGELSGYLIVRAEITPGPEEQRRIADLPPSESNRVLSEVRLELARAKVGYSGLALPITTIAIFKRMPIGESLSEDVFMARLEEVEAAFNAIAVVSYMAFDRNAPIPAVPKDPRRDR
jgi:hypothetical protein